MPKYKSLAQRKRTHTGKEHKKWLDRMAKQGKLLTPDHPQWAKVQEMKYTQKYRG